MTRFEHTILNLKEFKIIARGYYYDIYFRGYKINTIIGTDNNLFYFMINKKVFKSLFYSDIYFRERIRTAKHYQQKKYWEEKLKNYKKGYVKKKYKYNI